MTNSITFKKAIFVLNNKYHISARQLSNDFGISVSSIKRWCSEKNSKYKQELEKLISADLEFWNLSKTELQQLAINDNNTENANEFKALETKVRKLVRNKFKKEFIELVEQEPDKYYNLNLALEFKKFFELKLQKQIFINEQKRLPKVFVPRFNRNTRRIS